MASEERESFSLLAVEKDAEVVRVSKDAECVHMGRTGKARDQDEGRLESRPFSCLKRVYQSLRSSGFGS